MISILQRMRRIGAVAKAEALQLIRDRFTLSLLLTVPAVQLVLFGFTVNLNPKNLPIAIAGQDAQLIRPLVEQSGYFRVVGKDLAPGQAMHMVRTRQVLIAVESTRTENNLPFIKLFADASDPAAIRPALLALQIAVWKKASGVSTGLDVEWLYNENGDGAWAIAPGLIGVIVMITMLLLGALCLVRERERGTWESLLTTPMSTLDAILGKLAPLLLFALLQTTLVLLLSQLLFAVPLRGSLLAFYVAAIVFAFAHLILGFIVSACAATQLQAIQTAVFFYLPCMLLSGFMFPFQGMPRWAQLAGEVLPLTHFVRVARGVMLRGEGVSEVALEMAPVGLLASILFFVAHSAYRLRSQ